MLKGMSIVVLNGKWVKGRFHKDVERDSAFESRSKNRPILLLVMSELKILPSSRRRGLSGGAGYTRIPP
jgi:hypothetical protein